MTYSKELENTDENDRKIVLSPHCLCETMSGNLAHAVGRIRFRPGRPMLVEHVGGLYLEHTLDGRVITPGFGDDYRIMHVWTAEEAAGEALPALMLSRGKVRAR